MPASRLSLQHDDPQEPETEPGKGLLVLLVVLGLCLGALGYLAWDGRRRTNALEQQLAARTVEMQQASTLAQQALDRATAAETAARAAAEGRQVAETQSERARREAEEARQQATTATETAAQAKAEADQIRKRAEAEVNRLEEALGQVAETRRTALGLVMNLGSDHLKFEFNKAELMPKDRELLSRVAGILLTSKEYTVSVNGHTDDVGSAAYNLKLSERRAQTVRDYLVKAGLPADIVSVQGHGKALPLVKGTSEAARAKNRRVELGIVHTRIRYGR